MEQIEVEIEATVAEETDDVVRIMTTHGAKGLEFPIVALANLGTKPQIKSEPVPREEESFLHFRVGREEGYGHFPTPGYKEIWEDEKEHYVAETLRLLYVAATRARDHLLVPCIAGPEHAAHLLGALVGALPIDDEELVEIVPLEDLEPTTPVTASPSMPTRRPTSSCIRGSSRFATSTTRSLRGAADVSIRASTPLDQRDPKIHPEGP